MERQQRVINITQMDCGRVRQSTARQSIISGMATSRLLWTWMTVTGTALRFMFVAQICWRNSASRVAMSRRIISIIHRMPMGDVVNLTDADGAVTKSYTYDAFGVEQNIDDADTNAFRYCGEYYDAETGTIYLRARYYSPTTGRFISRDTFVGRKEDPLSLNKYTYCANNPVIFTDPQGLDYYYYYGEDQAKAAAINIEELEAFGQTVHPYLRKH